MQLFGYHFSYTSDYMKNRIKDQGDFTTMIGPLYIFYYAEDLQLHSYDCLSANFPLCLGLNGGRTFILFDKYSNHRLPY